MTCEYSRYPDGDKTEKPVCTNEKKIAEDDYFGNKCPLIYYCTINERFEQTSDMLTCKYRRGEYYDG